MVVPVSFVDLFWIPLGAGGSGLVRLNGRIYEAIKARREQRQPFDLLHTALKVRTGDGDFVVETMWPSPDRFLDRRGVVLEGPVVARRLYGARMFRYEIRRWRNGLLPDCDEAIGGPQRLSDTPGTAKALLEWTESIPPLIWGRDQAGTGEMWNSNSVISWLLTRTGLPMESIQPPTGARAPGWDAGIAVARRTDAIDAVHI